MIELEGLGKRFGKREAVRALDLSVDRGEIFGLLGHNGAGKSTAIGMMLGQVWPTTGSARLCGHDVMQDRNRALSQVGAIFEAPAFYEYLSGRRNLEILSQYTERTPATRITEVIDWVGLTGREVSAVKTYSHGMRTRLALAQALLPEPKLLILDEPADGLDPEGMLEMRETILRLREELGLTILLSSHLLNEVEQLCTRIAVLREGEKVFEGNLTEIQRTSNRLRLRVDDFTQVVDRLQKEGLAEPLESEPDAVALEEGVTSAEVIRRLVKWGYDVHEAHVREQTLEDFYMELVGKKEDAAE